jgi:hypothetical protein
VFFIDDELRVLGVKAPGHAEILSAFLKLLEGLVGKGPPEVGVRVLGLAGDDLVEVCEGSLVLLGDQVALGPLVEVVGLGGQLDRLRQGRDRALVLVQVRQRNAQVVVDVRLH